MTRFCRQLVASRTLMEAASAKGTIKSAKWAVVASAASIMILLFCSHMSSFVCLDGRGTGGCHA